MPTKTKQTKAQNEQKSADAKLFWNGRSQAVRLPKEFRFEGDRVKVTRVGAGVLLQPVSNAVKEKPEEWFARIDGLKGDPIFREGRKGADLVAAMQASPYKEISLEPERGRMPVREIEF
ncbi:MAG: AbrB/MazE/SpoVT family DNA-binding domain-containing protein [Terracidiphilus sp.]